MKALKIIENIILAIAICFVTTGAFVFLYINQEIINNDILLIIPFSFFILLMLCVFILGLIKPKFVLKNQVIITFATALITVIIGFLLILFYAITDYFQPLSLFNIPIIGMAGFLIFYGIAELISFIIKSNSLSGMVIGIAVLCIFLATSIWSTSQNYGVFSSEAESVILFSDGDNGYSTFRIPVIVNIDKDVINSNLSKSLEHDMLVAIVEGRRNSSLDNGAIDIIIKTSIDNGITWSAMSVVLRWEDYDSGEGRVADPTAVFNKLTGKLCLLYRAGSKLSGYSTECYYIEGSIESDFSINWDYDNIINVNDKLGASPSPGPSKGLQLLDGTLAFPARSSGASYVIYTNDNGNTWTRGADSGTGGECDIAMIDDNEMILISREGNMSSFPRNNELRFAFSDDRGLTWYQETKDSTLRTPVCMSSVASYNGVIYCAYANSYLTRANLSYATSDNKGLTWDIHSLYSGATGYAVGTFNSEGQYFVIAEIGKVEYNEEIRLFRIS